MDDLKKPDDSPEGANTLPGHDGNVRDALCTRKPTVYSPGTPMDVEGGVHEEAPDQETTEEPDNETPTAGVSESSKPDKSEAWRLDKKGRHITPKALYMRFYRRLRSALA